MAFPAVVNSAITESTTAQADHAITMPGSLVAGNLLVCKARGSATGDFTQSDGWSVLFAGDASDASSGDRLWIGYKVVAGGDTLTLNSAGTPKVAAITWQISGADSTTPDIQLSTAASGTSTSPDPPSFSPTGGAKDWLWLWIGGWEGEQTSPPSGAPTNYSGAIGADTGTAGSVASNCQVAGAWRQNNTATEDPPAWTISVSDDWTAYTIAIAPQSGITLTPSPAVLDLGDLGGALGLTLALAPSPAVVDLGALGGTAAFPPIVLAPNPAVLDLNSVLPTLGLTLALTPAPAPVDLNSVLPALGLSLALSPTPAVVDLGDLGGALGLVLALPATPAVLDLGGDGGTVSVGGGTTTLTPDPAILDLASVLPALGLSLGLSPDPAVLDLGALGGAASPGTVFLLPAPAVLDLSVLGPTSQFGPFQIVSGSDHQLILDSIAFYEEYDTLDEMGQRHLLKVFLLEHGGQEIRDWKGHRTIIGAFWPVRLTLEDVDGD